MQEWTSEQIKSHEVRLFPTIRISSERAAELRATASPNDLQVAATPLRDAMNPLIARTDALSRRLGRPKSLQ